MDSNEFLNHIRQIAVNGKNNADKMGEAISWGSFQYIVDEISEYTGLVEDGAQLNFLDKLD